MINTVAWVNNVTILDSLVQDYPSRSFGLDIQLYVNLFHQNISLPFLTVVGKMAFKVYEGIRV